MEHSQDSLGKKYATTAEAAAIARPFQSENAAAISEERYPRLSRMFRQEWPVAILYFGLDFALWIGIYGTMSYIRGDAYFATISEFVIIDLIQLAIIVQALYIVGGYDRNVDKQSLGYMAEHILAVAGAAVFGAMIIYSIAAFDESMKPSRGVLLFSFLTFLPISLFYRRWIRKYVAAATANRAFLVIGCGKAAARFFECYSQSPNRQQLRFIATSNENVGRPIAGEGTPVIEGDLDMKLNEMTDHCSGIILAERVNTISTQLLNRLVRTQFQRTRVYTLESFYETHWRYVPLDAVDPVWPLQTGFQLARISPYHYLKRLFDIAFSLVALIFVAPIMGLIAMAVWLEDRSPVVFRQTRVGREDERFTIFKFRTMRVCEETDDNIYTREGDPRVTRVGRWLRKLRFDELLQLWNVLKGEMSLIGPRAEWSRCAERYEKRIPFYHFRHLVKPGITGWAQVNYPYGESDQDAIEKLKYDLYYIRHYSLKLDAMIALKTIHVMLFSKGR